MTYWTQQRLASFLYALHGLRTAWRTEVNLRIHCIAAVLVATAGAALHLQRWEWLAIIGCCVIVITAEIFNTCLEKLIDHIHPQKHRNIKRIKDMSAAAVFVTAIGACAIGLLIFLPKIFNL